ncbi:MAG TPA: radical SAM protein [Hydrogenophilus thermoluteolus]|nr:radical SAM protein [Hydrogenophilus thermoluteolus]
MQRQLRLLLTNRCSACCAYCHNEGQIHEKGHLPLSAIETLLAYWQTVGISFDEIVLSGGEPTLHPQIARIAQLCHTACRHVSINTNGAHPSRLLSALRWISEVKIHLDSFDPGQQVASMGIALERVLTTIAHARNHQVRVLLNHPVRDVQESATFVKEASNRGIDCKLIAMLGDAPEIAITQALQAMGYVAQRNSCWYQPTSGHRVFLSACQPVSNRQTFFVDAEGVRCGLDATLLLTWPQLTEKLSAHVVVLDERNRKGA